MTRVVSLDLGFDPSPNNANAAASAGAAAGGADGGAAAAPPLRVVSHVADLHARAIEHLFGHLAALADAAGGAGAAATAAPSEAESTAQLRDAFAALASLEVSREMTCRVRIGSL